jgi:hypothetical protein
LPVLVSVILCGALCVETVCGAKFKAIVERPTTGPSPVPLRLTVCVLPPRTLLLLSLMVRVPVRVPGAVGVKTTLTVQELLAATLLPQVFVSEKSPLMVRLEITSETLPVLESVTACGLLAVPCT